jgi:hypothetical protein
LSRAPLPSNYVEDLEIRGTFLGRPIEEPTLRRPPMRVVQVRAA